MKNAFLIRQVEPAQNAVAMMMDAAKPIPNEWLLNTFYVICADRGMGADEFEVWANDARMKLEGRMK